MNYAIGQLLRRLTEVAPPHRDPEFHARLSVLDIGDRLYLDYFGSPFDESYRFLSADAGYDSQNFIRNLAGSSCFFQLETLEFGEYNETYLDDFPRGCATFDDYRRLFKSEVFSTVRRFVWRNPVCSEEEIAELRSLRPKDELQIRIVRFSSQYV